MQFGQKAPIRQLDLEMVGDVWFIHMKPDTANQNS